MPIDSNYTQTQALYKDFNYQVTNPILNQVKNETKLLNTDGSNLAKLQEDKVELSASENDKYSADDGKISPKDKLINFTKGIISPLTNMFKSPKNFLTSVGMVAGISALTVATGGAIAPLLVVVGLVGGSMQLVTSANKARTAKTDDEARNAWRGLGSGTTAVVSSVAGAKTAAKGANIEGAETMNSLQATVACIKNTPKAISNSFKSFASGEFLVNFKLKEKTTKTNDENVNERNKQIEPEEVKPDEKPIENNYEQSIENNKQTAKQEKITETQTNKELLSVQNEQIKTTENSSEVILKQEKQHETTGENAQKVKSQNADEFKGKIKIKRSNSDLTFDSQVSSADNHNYTIEVNNGEHHAVANGHVDTFHSFSETDVDFEPYIIKQYEGAGYDVSGFYINDLNGNGGGAGTAAIYQAVKTSNEVGCDGKIVLHASIIDKNKGTPIPFYNKLGFKAISNETQSEIELAMQYMKETGVYNGPTDVMMYLPMEKVNQFMQ